MSGYTKLKGEVWMKSHSDYSVCVCVCVWGGWGGGGGGGEEGGISDA